MFYILCLLALIGFTSSSDATEIGIVPHKALYEISLTSKKNSVDISNITGKMFYEIKKSCDAWVSAHKYDMLYDFVQGVTLRTTSEFSTYESFDGKSFNFTIQRNRDGVLYEEYRGSANANDKNRPNEAIYSIPEGLSFKLPEGTLFPTRHTIEVLDQIKSGKKFFNTTIFDGSDGQGPIAINSLILSKSPPYKIDTKYESNIAKSLLIPQGWKVRIAFFPLDSFDETSDYEMTVILHENGVVSNIDVEYKDFSVTHKLIAIEPLEDECLTDIKKR